MGHTLDESGKERLFGEISVYYHVRKKSTNDGERSIGLTMLLQVCGPWHGKLDSNKLKTNSISA